MRRALAAALALPCLLVATAATAQRFDKICFPQEDAGDGLSLAVDQGNRLHASRISRLTGGLLHTRVAADRTVIDAEVTRGVSLLALNEVDDTGIMVEGSRPRVCYHHAVSNAFEVAIQTPQGWTREVVHAGVGAGRWCALRRHRRTMVAVFGSDDGRLRMAMRMGPDDWAVSIIDEADEAVGRHVSLTEIDGALVAAHRTESDRLRISWQLADGWQSQPLVDLAIGSGASPVALAGADGELIVVHGTPGPPGTSDGGLLLTSGRLGMFETISLSDEETGGSNGAIRTAEGVAVATRLFRRSAVFGDSDALRYYRNANIGFFDALESSSSAERRQAFRNIGMIADRFALPVIGALNETGRFQDMRGSTFTCVWLPPDRDADGIPDDAEGGEGTDPDDADSDDDGRLDGQEVLVQGTDPLVPDPPPPDMGLQPDLGIADFGIDVDAGTEGDDGVPDDGVEEDEGVAADLGGDSMPISPDEGLDQGQPVDAAPDQGAQPVVDRGPVVDLSDAEPVGYEPIRPPKLDGGPDDGGGSGSDDCAQRPGAPAGSVWWLAGLLLMAWRRRR